MSVLYQTVINTGKRCSFRKLMNTKLSSCKCLFVRKSSDAPKKFLSFDEVVAQRRAEAQRSLVVQVNSDASFNELYGYCSRYASINGIHHYKNSGGEHFMLIEFSSEDNLKEVVRTCSAHQRDIDVMALQSPFLWFRAISGKKEKLPVPNSASFITKYGNMAINEDKLFEELLNCKSVSEQIQMLYDKTTLNDLGVRLRYMVARQLEVILKSLYANIAVRPFGSSVNGFGKMGCDLDLVVTNVLTDEMSDASKRLVYQEKKCEGGRSPWQRHMELVGELVELRVPIVKYVHELAGLDVDLCYNNMSGVYMSALVWQLGALDARVRPLTALVRRWAAAAGLTAPQPGRWITNFPLTLMVLFYLQQPSRQGSVLPSVKSLVAQAEKCDVRIAEENLNCTFLRDMNKLPVECYGQNPADLETLLLQFFEFYSQFDFQEKAISINEGIPIRKPNALPLYIVNPLEQALNVSRNVSFEECERLKLEIRNAAWQLEEARGNKTDDWGILSLIEKKSSRGLKKLLRVGNSHRLVSVKDLFKDDDTTDGLRSKLRQKSERDVEKSDKHVENSVKEMKDAMSKDEQEKKEPKTKLKNTQLAHEVYRIRRGKMV